MDELKRAAPLGDIHELAVGLLVIEEYGKATDVKRSRLNEVPGPFCLCAHRQAPIIPTPPVQAPLNSLYAIKNMMAAMTRSSTRHAAGFEKTGRSHLAP
jgi:hypothetical protein